MKTGTYLSALLLALGLSAGSAQAVDLGTVVGGGIGAVAGAAIGDSVGGRDGAIVGSGVGGVLGAVVGHSLGEPRYSAPPRAHRHVHVPSRMVEYRYAPYSLRRVEPYPPGWGSGRHDRPHRHHGHRHGGHR